jgi:hypothetical protein
MPEQESDAKRDQDRKTHQDHLTDRRRALKSQPLMVMLPPAHRLLQSPGVGRLKAGPAAHGEDQPSSPRGGKYREPYAMSGAASHGVTHPGRKPAAISGCSWSVMRSQAKSVGFHARHHVMRARRNLTVGDNCPNNRASPRLREPRSNFPCSPKAVATTMLRRRFYTPKRTRPNPHVKGSSQRKVALEQLLQVSKPSESTRLS